MARWLSLACVLATGCSLALSGPDPARPKTKPPECDTGKGLVTIDGLLATTLGVTALALAGSSNGSEQGASIVPALFGAAFVASALRGNSAVNDCREAMAEYGTEEPPQPIAEARPHPQLAAIKVKKPAPPPLPVVPPPPPTQSPTPPAPAQAPPQSDAWSEFWKEAP